MIWERILTRFELLKNASQRFVDKFTDLSYWSGGCLSLEAISDGLLSDNVMVVKLAPSDACATTVSSYYIGNGTASIFVRLYYSTETVYIKLIDASLNEIDVGLIPPQSVYPVSASFSASVPAGWYQIKLTSSGEFHVEAIELVDAEAVYTFPVNPSSYRLPDGQMYESYQTTDARVAWRVSSIKRGGLIEMRWDVLKHEWRNKLVYICRQVQDDVSLRFRDNLTFQFSISRLVRLQSYNLEGQGFVIKLMSGGNV